MVFGPKFPWSNLHKAVKCALKPEPFKFDPFGDEDVAVSLTIEHMLDSLGLDDIPLPPNIPELEYPEVVEPELLHPRPVRSVALRDALDLFEEIAQSEDVDWLDDSPPASPCLSETETDLYAIRLVTRDASEQGGYSPFPFWDTLPAFPEPYQSAPYLGPQLYSTSVEPLNSMEDNKVGKAYFEPQSSSSPAQDEPVRSSSGLACLSPGFLDHFSGHSSRGQPPMPTLALRKGQLCTTSPSSGSDNGSSTSSSPSSLISPTSSTESLPSIKSSFPSKSSLSTSSYGLPGIFPLSFTANKDLRSPSPEPWSGSMREEIAAYINWDD